MTLPPGAPFAIRVVAMCDQAVRVRVKGELDLATAPRLAEVLEREISTGKEIVLDLSGVVFMDCTGLRAILAAVHESRRNGRELPLASPLPAQVRRLLEMADAQHVFSVIGQPAPSPLRLSTPQ